MKVVSTTEVRNNLKSIFDMVYREGEEVIVHRKNGENVSIVPSEWLDRIKREMIDRSTANEPSLGYGNRKGFEETRSMFRSRLDEIESGAVSSIPFDDMWESIEADMVEL